jgi:hypothetical protein
MRDSNRKAMYAKMRIGDKVVVEGNSMVGGLRGFIIEKFGTRQLVIRFDEHKGGNGHDQYFDADSVHVTGDARMKVPKDNWDERYAEILKQRKHMADSDHRPLRECSHCGYDKLPPAPQRMACPRCDKYPNYKKPKSY